MNALILASSSHARARLLASAGLSFTQRPCQLDEAVIRKDCAASGLSTDETALRLAEAKAMSISAEHPSAPVIGADQILEKNGAWFEKPASVQDAREQLSILRGGTHSLASAVVVACDGILLWRHVDRARLTMRPFSDAFLDWYLETEGSAVTSSVGAYRLEGIGSQLFSEIEGDFFTVLGLPLLPLLAFLRDKRIIGV